MKGDLQDLYRHLDTPILGTPYMAWYGQCRAEGMSHDEAIAATVREFHLTEAAWYQKRMAGRVKP